MITPLAADHSPQARAAEGFDRSTIRIDRTALQVRCPEGRASAGGTPSSSTDVTPSSSRPPVLTAAPAPPATSAPPWPAAIACSPCGLTNTSN